MTLHSKQYRLFWRNPSVLSPCNPRRTLEGHGDYTEGFFLTNLYCLECIGPYLNSNPPKSGARVNLSYSFFLFLVCPLDKLLTWFSTQTSVVNFRYYLFCLCNVRRQYLLPGIQGIYCFLTGVPSLPTIALPKGRFCSLVNQVYTSFPLMLLPPFGLHWPKVG